MTTLQALSALPFLLAFTASGGADARTIELAPPPAADTLVGPGASVPFVGQGDLLCGGASAAMIERHWGRTGVYAEEYADIVRPAEGGIRTSELVGEMAHRGFRVRALQPEPEALVQALTEGVPPMVLLGPSSDVLHYVVVVAADREGVRIHDPKIGPFRSLSWDDFLARWSDSGRWAVAAVPTDPADPVAPASETPSAGPTEGVPRPPERLERAMQLLRAGEHEAARRAARALMEEEGRDPAVTSGTARRLIATAYYREGLERDALRVWNEVGEPRVDLVSVHGARLTRHSVLSARTGVLHGRVLEPAALDLADRRLIDLPAVSSARTSYRPLPSGAVSVDAYVTELPRWPGRYDLVPELVRAVTDREARAGFGPFLGAADRWSFAGGWRDVSPFWTASVASVAPPLPGVVTLAVDWRRERYASSPPAGGSEERLRTSLSLREWVAPAVRLGATLGLERWEGDGRLGSAGASALVSLADGDARLSAEVESWRGSGRGFSRVSGRFGVTHAWDGGPSLEWVLGAAATSADAPRLVWPGAGTGELRRPLLRAHPLDDGAGIGGRGFGPHLVHSTLELRGSRRIFGPLRLGAALFADGARVWPDHGADPHHLMDVGAGLFVDSGDETMRLDLATGEAGWVLSARVSHHPGQW